MHCSTSSEFFSHLVFLVKIHVRGDVPKHSNRIKSHFFQCLGFVYSSLLGIWVNFCLRCVHKPGRLRCLRPSVRPRVAGGQSKAELKGVCLREVEQRIWMGEDVSCGKMIWLRRDCAIDPWQLRPHKEISARKQRVSLRGQRRKRRWQCRR